MITNRGAVLFNETAEKLVMAWDNRVVSKASFAYWFMILFWLIWTPLTLFFTIVLFVAQIDIGTTVFLILWLIGGWFGVVGIPYILAKRLTEERIEMDLVGVSWWAIGPYAGKRKTVPYYQIKELALGWYYDRDEHESMVTLNIYMKTGGRRMLAYWLSKEEKRHLYERICQFLEFHSIDIETKIYGDSQTPQDNVGNTL